MQLMDDEMTRAPGGSSQPPGEHQRPWPARDTPGCRSPWPGD
jgi:hypothetical protein